MEIIWKCIFYILIFSVAPSVRSQDESLTEITIDMFAEMEKEIFGLSSKIGDLQAEMSALAASIQNLAGETAVVGSVELAEIQELITVSNKQENDIKNLNYFNSLWQQNFRNINKTFQKMQQRGTPTTLPILNAPSVVGGRSLVILPMITDRSNITVRVGNGTRNYQLSNLKMLKNVTANGPPTRLRTISNSTLNSKSGSNRGRTRQSQYNRNQVT